MIDCTGTCNALADLMEAERRAILTGHIAYLPDLAERKAELLSILIECVDSVDAFRLRDLRNTAAENSNLLAGAIEGVKSARARLLAISAASTQLQTYDGSGKTRQVTLRSASMERLA